MIINSPTVDSLILGSPPPWTVARHNFRVIKSQVRMKISVGSYYVVKDRVEFLDFNVPSTA